MQASSYLFAVLLCLYFTHSMGIKTTTETIANGRFCSAYVTGGIAAAMFKNTTTFERNYVRFGNKDDGEIYGMAEEYFAMDCSRIGTAAMDSIDLKVRTICNYTVNLQAPRTCWSSAMVNKSNVLLLISFLILELL